MWVRELKLQNFRNFSDFGIEFKPGINIIKAANGTGKTNLVEAISLLSVPKSFRKAKDKNMIHKNVFVEEINVEDIGVDLLKAMNNFARITANVSTVPIDDPSEMFSMEYFIQHASKTDKTLRVNGKKHTSTDFVGRFHSVVFSPEVIDVINSSPGNRRAVLDRLMSIHDPEYLLSLLKYRSILKSRNKLLLDRGVDRDLLRIWDNSLIEQGTDLIIRKMKFFKSLSKFLNSFDGAMSKSKIFLEIGYRPNVSAVEVIDFEAVEDAFREKLERNINREMMYKHTMTGPHRDDFGVLMNGYDLKDFGSRGQQRIGILNLFFAYIFLLESESKKPVILLDDVFSELDEEHRQMLIEFIKSKNVQVIITATDIDQGFFEIDPKLNLIELEKNIEVSKANA